MRRDRGKAFRKAVNIDLDKFLAVQINDFEYEIVYKRPHLKYQDAGVSGTENNRPNTPYKYTDKPPPLSAMIKFVKDNNIQGRNKKTGRFITRKSLAFAFRASIFKKGFKAQNYIPSTELSKQIDRVAEAFADVDLDKLDRELDKII